MAILYGTQSNGETLPVLVDQFGNLLAKGIEGEPGPPGPPGIGQLPADPFEGALLGWEDGELAWVGGSVPLPAGTYGPYVYVPGDERLDIPQDASSLINGQQLIMSDINGQQIYAEISTDNILNVTAETGWNQSEIWSSNFTGANNPGNLFDGNTTTFASVGPSGVKPGPWESIFTPTTAIPATTSIQILVSAANDGIGQITINNEQMVEVGPSYSKKWFTLALPSSGVINTIKLGRRATSIDFSNVDYYLILVDGKILVDQGVDPGSAPTTGNSILTFPSTSNFGAFAVGEEVNGEMISAINATNKSMTIGGTQWLGMDGTGDPAGLTTVSKLGSGQGSVFTAFEGAILLRGNNKEWVDGFYVTAPEQRIAARKVGASAIKRNTKRDQLR